MKPLTSLFCLILLFFAFARTGHACTELSLDLARDSDAFKQVLQDCSGNSEPAAQGLTGYFFRHGYGVPRDIEKAAEFFRAGAERCDVTAWCGLQRLSGSLNLPACDIDCGYVHPEGDVVQARGTPDVARIQSETAARIIESILQQHPNLRRNASVLQATVEAALEPLQQLHDEQQNVLCDSYVDRAVAAVGLGHQANIAARNRQDSIAYWKKKLQKGPDARAERKLARLVQRERDGKADKQVFFEKYSNSLLSARHCNESALEFAYKNFATAVREARITPIEYEAFNMFQEHLASVKQGTGVRSRWFEDLYLLGDNN